MAEHSAGGGGCLNGQEVLVLGRERVVLAVRTAFSAAPPVVDVHRERCAHGASQTEVVLAALKRAADDNQPRPRTEGQKRDRGSVEARHDRTARLAHRGAPGSLARNEPKSWNVMAE